MYVLLDPREQILAQENHVFLWQVRVHSIMCKVSSSLIDVAFVAVLTFDIVDNTSSVNRFRFFFTVQNESVHNFGGFMGQSDSHCRHIFDVGEQIKQC